MPMPSLPIRLNTSELNFQSSYSSHSPIQNQTHKSLSKNISSLQLNAIYNEITKVWSTEKWLSFINDHKETYLTLIDNEISYQTTDILTKQMAIDRHYLKNFSSYLNSAPE